MLGLTVAVIFCVFGGLFIYNRVVQPEGPSQIGDVEAYRGGAGGSPQMVIDYHKQATELWKSGKKEEAKNIAQKGIDENKSLTLDEQGEIPGQLLIVQNLYGIVEGTYRGD